MSGASIGDAYVVWETVGWPDHSVDPIMESLFPGANEPDRTVQLETLLSDKQVGSGRIIAFGHFERGLQNLDQIGPLGNDLRREAVLFAIGGTQPPVANFTANVTSVTAPLTVQFTDTSTGVITGHAWEFGDTGTSTEQIHPTRTPQRVPILST